MTATRATTSLAVDASLPQRLLDVLFPPRCAHCGAAGVILCGACWGDIHEPRAPRCIRCDRSLSSGSGAAARHCPVCSALLRDVGQPALGRIVVAADYEGPVGSAIRALKFRRQRRLAQPLAALLAEATRRAGTPVDVIIPMPLHAGRRRERGYNQAELLARPLARALGVPLRDDLLARVRATQPQTRLSRRERLANVAGAFALASPVAAAQALAGKRVALVDDVTTTGATLEAAAEALSAAHPAEVCAFAVARPVRAALLHADDVALDV